MKKKGHVKLTDEYGTYLRVAVNIVSVKSPLCPSTLCCCVKATWNNNFDVLLTVHYSNDQFWFQLIHHNFTLLTKSLYMFRAPTCGVCIVCPPEDWYVGARNM